MHSEILNEHQSQLLSLMAQFRREYYLVGGTAIALHIGHRRSIDFDLFKPTAINHKRNLDKISASPFCHIVTRRVAEQMNLIINDVKEKMFRAQLCYFDDIDYTEAVEYLVPNPPSEQAIKQSLITMATEGI